MSDPHEPPVDPTRSPYGQQPGQPAAQPTTSGSPQPGYPQPVSGAAPAPALAGTLGRTAFIIAVITAALGLLFALATPLVIVALNGDHTFFQVFSLSRLVLGLLLGVLALVLGVVAARRRAQPVLAGIAIGVGGVEVLGTVTAFLSNFAYTVL